jgi:hypothetical protein
MLTEGDRQLHRLSTEIAPFGSMKESGIGPICWSPGARNTASRNFLEVKYLCMGGIAMYEAAVSWQAGT